MSTITAAPRLRSHLPELARGKVIVIDYFASGRCGVVVGDITAGFAAVPPSDTHVELADLDGVRVFAEARLIPLLEKTAVTLDRRRLPFGPRLAIRLDRSERWLEFLQQPGTCGRPRPADRQAL